MHRHARFHSLCVALAAWLAFPSCATNGDGPAGTIPAERQRELEGWWRLYQSDAEQWPAARARWLAGSPAEREALVLNLLRHMVQLGPKRVKDAEGGLVEAWRRPQKELLSLDRAAVEPILVVALRTTRDPPAQEAITDTLGRLGTVEPLIEALDRPEERDAPTFRTAALDALVRSGGPRALERVRQALKAPDWQERAAPAGALGRARFAERDPACAALTAALGETDPFVFERLLGALVAQRCVQAAPRVAVELETATRREDEDRREACIKALRQLTGRTVFGDAPAAWQQVAARAARDA